MSLVISCCILQGNRCDLLKQVQTYIWIQYMRQKQHLAWPPLFFMSVFSFFTFFIILHIVWGLLGKLSCNIFSSDFMNKLFFPPCDFSDTLSHCQCVRDHFHAENEDVVNHAFSRSYCMVVSNLIYIYFENIPNTTDTASTVFHRWL